MESPLALYRRYRPETFAEVNGQEHVTEPLRYALAGNRERALEHLGTAFEADPRTRAWAARDRDLDSIRDALPGSADDEAG